MCNTYGHKSDITAGVTLALKLLLHWWGAKEEEVTPTQKETVAQCHVLSSPFVLVLQDTMLRNVQVGDYTL